MKRHPPRVLVAALALSLLAACSTAKDTGGAAKSSSPPATTGGSAAIGDRATNGANQIGVEQRDLSKTIISKQFVHPLKPQRKVTVGILSLERKGKLAILKVVATPEFADAPADRSINFTAAIDGHPLWWLPTLVDLTNLKQYKVLGGSGFLSYEDGEALNGQPIYAWAVFAAPPANVTAIDLNVIDWMPRFTNVPIP